MSHTLMPFIRDGSQDIDARTSIYKNWGTFTRALVTMFEATLANWGPICWNLSNHVSEWFGLFFILYKCGIGLAVVQVILSVFIQQTFKIAAQDEEVMITAKANQAAATLKQFTHLFEAMDTNGDGKISSSEFSAVMDSPLVKTWLSALDVDAEQVSELFTLLDDGDGTLAPEEFIAGLKAIKGAAKRTDVLELKHQLQKINSLMIEMRTHIVGTDGFRCAGSISTIDLNIM